ncbi:MAG: polysaccharide biosynthesis/export family protein [Pseudomonadota bacterium]
MIRPALLIALALPLAGCAGLPSASPTVGQVMNPLKDSGVAVVEIRPETVSGEAALQRTLLPWMIGDAGGVNDAIRPGDRVIVTVYETGYALFSGGTGGDGGERGGLAPAGSGGSTRAFPPIVVPDDGFLRFPYVGAFSVAGMEAADVARTLEQRLRGKSQFAQVLVNVEPGPLRGVVMAGDVARAGRLVLTPARERLLDAVALSGGPVARKADTVVRLTRGAASGEVRLDAISPTSPENVVLAPGDRIELTRATRSLTVLGAARSVSEIPFDSAQLTLSEALARAGGALDDKADARGVFIFRYERGERNGVQVAKPVVYRMNLLDPASYFAAQRFEMREKDVMLISNAQNNQLGKFIQLLNLVTAPVVTIDFLSNR